MAGFTRSRMLLATGAAGVLLALAACTPTPTLTPTEAPAPEPYSGPAAFIGDELELFLLTPEEITGLIPDATEIATSSALTMVSDGGGAPATPAICDVLYAEQSLGSVAARVVEWKSQSDSEQRLGRLLVLQFPDEAHVEERMDQLTAAAEQCEQFDKEGAVTFDAVIADGDDHARAIAGTLVDTNAGHDWRQFSAYASAGNVLVTLWQPFDGDQSFDAEVAADLLAARADEAHSALLEKLTAMPPVVEDLPAGDASKPWSEWAITVAGVGPVRLGEPVETAVAAAGVSATPPEFAGGWWTLEEPGGAGSMLVFPVEGGGAVLGVTVGSDRSSLPDPQDGAGLPAADGIRVGDPVSAAVAAYPGGTTVRVISSADHWYAVPDRDGRLLRFRTDRDADDPQAIIVGITVEDATAWRGLRFTD